MRLSGAAFNRHLRHMGQDVEWRKSSLCPCQNEFSAAPQTSCGICHGKGYTWAAGVAGVVGVTGQRASVQYKEFGEYMEGDSLLSVQADSVLYEIGKYDRVSLLNATDRFSVTRVHDDNDLLDLRLKEITRIHWLTEDLSAEVEGVIPSWDSDTGQLTWADPEGEPPAGAQYTITGTRYMEYFVWTDMSGDRNMHQGETLPRKVPVRLWDLFGR